MAETFFVRLSDAGTATWGAFDATGRLVGSARARRAAVRPAGARRLGVALALVDAVDVLTAEAALPAASQARLRQIVPFSLEESLADDVDQMVFAIGSRLPSGATTRRGRRARARLDAWLGELRAAGIVPHARVLRGRRHSGHPGDARAHHRRRTHRRPQARPAAVRVRGLRARSGAASRAGAQARGARAAPRRVFTDAAGRATFRRRARALGGQFASADVKIMNDGVFPHLAATLAQRAGTNLLQGSYAPKSNWLAMVRPWRLAASLAAASIGLALLLQGAEYWQLKRADAALGDVVATACQRVVGESSTSACQREVSQRLGANAGSATENFLSTLAAIAAVRDSRIAHRRVQLSQSRHGPAARCAERARARRVLARARANAAFRRRDRGSQSRSTPAPKVACESWEPIHESLVLRLADARALDRRCRRRRRGRDHSVGLRREAVARRVASLRTAVDTKQRLLIDIARVEGAQPSCVAAAGKARSKRWSSSSGHRGQVRARSAAHASQRAERRRRHLAGRLVRRAARLARDAAGTYGVDVESASFSSGREPGLVNGQVSLRRL